VAIAAVAQQAARLLCRHQAAHLEAALQHQLQAAHQEAARQPQAAALANVTGGARSTQPVKTKAAVGAGKTLKAVLPPAPVTVKALAVVVKFVTK